jgi:hypothetical protein
MAAALLWLPFRDALQSTSLAVDPKTGKLYGVRTGGKPVAWSGVIDFKYNPTDEEQSALVQWIQQLDSAWAPSVRETRLSLWNQLVARLGLSDKPTLQRFSSEQEVLDFTNRFLASLDRDNLRKETAALLLEIEAERRLVDEDSSSAENVKRRALQGQLADVNHSVERLRKERMASSESELKRKQQELRRLNDVFVDVDRQSRKLRSAVQTAEARLALKIPATDSLRLKGLRDQIGMLTAAVEQARALYDRRAPSVYQVYERERATGIQASDDKITTVNIVKLSEIAKDQERVDSIKQVDDRIEEVAAEAKAPDLSAEDQAAFEKHEERLRLLRERIVNSPIPVRLGTAQVRRRLPMTEGAVASERRRTPIQFQFASPLPPVYTASGRVPGTGAGAASAVRRDAAMFRTPAVTRIQSAFRPTFQAQTAPGGAAGAAATPAPLRPAAAWTGLGPRFTVGRSPLTAPLGKRQRLDF